MARRTQNFRRSRDHDRSDSADGRLIVDQTHFDEVVERITASSAVAIDTEFHREGTYYPKLALIQLGFPQDGGRASTLDEVVLVDPQRVDVSALRAGLESECVFVFHAARQDLEILHLACGTGPRHLVDTQVAASFVGFSTPSLGALVEAELGVRLAKEDRLTDWMRRPLSRAQLEYAASDVAYLLPLWDRLRATLDELGRIEWAEEAFVELGADDSVVREPTTAWIRLRELRTLRGHSLAVAQALATWRERVAARQDVPVRSVLSDMGIASMAQAKPAKAEQVRSLRGVEGRNLRGGLIDEALAVVANADREPQQLPQPSGYELGQDLRPAVTLVTAWLAQRAKDLRLDPATLGTRADVEAFLARRPDARLGLGWRAGVVGDFIESLVNGSSAVAFEQGRGLIVVERAPGESTETSP